MCKVNTTETKLKKASKSQKSDPIHLADNLLQDAESALDQSIAISKEWLGDDELETTMNDLLNSSSELKDLLSTASDNYDPKNFLDNMIATMTQKEKEDLCSKLIHECNKEKSPEKMNMTTPKATASTNKASTSTKILEQAASNLVTSFEPVGQKPAKKPHLDNPEVNVNHRYVFQKPDINRSSHGIEDNEEINPSEDTSDKSITDGRSTELVHSELEKGKSVRLSRNPMYVDGTDDSNSSKRSNSSSISSSILESQDNPTQPPTPPLNMSSNDDADAPVIILDHNSPSTATRNIENGHYSGDNASTLVISSGNEEDNDNDSTLGYGDGPHDETITVSDSSTLTAETNETFDRSVGAETREVEHDHRYAEVGAETHEVEGDHTYAEIKEPRGQDLNGTCNIDLDRVMDGDISVDADEPVAGSLERFRREPTKLTMADLVADKDYEQFQAKLFVHSSPKPPLKPVRRKRILRPGTSNDGSDKQHSPQKKKKKKRSQPVYGPVNNSKGWVKMRCTEDDYLPDLVEQARKEASPHSDPLIGNMSIDEHSLDENRFEDIEESLSPSNDNPSEGENHNL